MSLLLKIVAQRHGKYVNVYLVGILIFSDYRGPMSRVSKFKTGGYDNETFENFKSHSGPLIKIDITKSSTSEDNLALTLTRALRGYAIFLGKKSRKYLEKNNK